MKRRRCFAVGIVLVAVSLGISAALAAASENVGFREGIAQLRAAQQAIAHGKLAEAKAVYVAMLKRNDIAGHHRWEAEERLREIERIEKGLPARDPAATRVALPKRPKPAVVFFVATDGDDANPGTKEKPFCSLERARNAIRALKQSQKLPAGGADVCIRGGLYRVLKTFELGQQDSGTADSPIVYRAADGETPIFQGGIRLSGFQPVGREDILARLPEESRAHVVCVDLKPLGVKGIKPLELGGFCSGRGFRTHPTQELFFNGQAMTLARWPNHGFQKVHDIVVHDGEPSHGLVGSKTGLFQYEGDRPTRWLKENDAWLYGYWFWGWADSYERIASIDTAKREIKLTTPYSTYGYRKGQPFYAVNVLAEIDMPGEWYLDRADSMLYFWPPKDLKDAVVELSLGEFPFLKIEKASHVAVEHLTWELGGGDAVCVNGGDHCLIAGCTVRRCGGNAIEVHGGAEHGVLSCNVYSMGRGGIVISGGDRKTLSPAKHFVENCEIHDLSRIDHTYTAAIVMSGVGNRIAHNRLHDILSSAIRVGGNDHVTEFNDVYRVVQESDDQGGVDMWGDPTIRGIIYRFNSWRCIGNWRHANEGPDCGQAGIRLDDAISGVLIYGNVFYRASAGKLGFGGVQIHGGKDNVIDNNLFVDCESAISLSPWGSERWKQFTAKSLDLPEIDRNLYIKRYPELATLGENADRNTVARNLVVQCRTFLRRDSGRLHLHDNLETVDDPGFRDRSHADFQLGDTSPAALKIGWRPIPVDEVGLYIDAYRKQLPPRTEEAN